MGETKRCCTCHEIRSIEDFNRRAAAKDGRQSRCRQCSRAWYVQNRTEHRANTSRRTAAVRVEHRRRIGEHLRQHPCVDCGQADIQVLEFDHPVGAVKVASVAALVANAGSWSVVQAEIDKCSVRCANCHRRVTSERAQDWRSRLARELATAEHERVTARLAAVLG